MQILKTSLTLFVFVLCLGTAFGQQPTKLEKKAAAKTEKLAERIADGDETATLSGEQQAQITEHYVAMYKELRQNKKAGGSPEEVEERKKLIRKKYNRMINKEVLTKEQRAAKRAGKSDRD